MNVKKVFVASSSEGLIHASEGAELLGQDLNGAAEVKLWTEEFQLTKTYIESLEYLLETSDFAVLFLAGDDLTKSREEEQLSPRDNVVFELGLFFGKIGRERCFFILRDDLKLKLPSDILGIEPAKFSISGKPTLKHACSRIGKVIRDAIDNLPIRRKLDNRERAVQAAMQKFGDQIIGNWWERIQLQGEKEKPALSFFTIQPDNINNTVQFEGKAYGPDGVQVANWRSESVRIEGKEIRYLRKCRRSDTMTTAWLIGKGEIIFDDSGNVIERGEGNFWESDESHPERTVIKLVELRRDIKDDHASTMLKGSEKEKKALVQNMLKAW